MLGVWGCSGLLGAAGSPRVCAGGRPVLIWDVVSAVGASPFPWGAAAFALPVSEKRRGGKAHRLIWKSPGMRQISGNRG